MNIVDQEIGQRARERRQALGLSLQQVAEALGISYQQFHKNETGANRIPAGRLHALSVILDVPAGYFFGDSSSRSVDPVPVDPASILDQPELRLLNEAFVKIRNKTLRRAVTALIETVANESEEPHADRTDLSDRNTRKKVRAVRRTAGQSISRKSSSRSSPP